MGGAEKSAAVRALDGVRPAREDECPPEVAAWFGDPEHRVYRLAGPDGGGYARLTFGLQDADEVEVHLQVRRWSPTTARHFDAVVRSLKVERARRGYGLAFKYATGERGGELRSAKLLARSGFGPPPQTWIRRATLGARG